MMNNEKNQIQTIEFGSKNFLLTPAPYKKPDGSTGIGLVISPNILMKTQKESFAAITPAERNAIIQSAILSLGFTTLASLDAVISVLTDMRKHFPESNR